MNGPGRSILSRTLLLLFLGLLPVAARAQVTVVLGGNHTTVMGNALTTLGYSYTLASGTMIPNPATYSLKKGDVIIISNDGGTPESVDYTNFLNAGGHVIAVGGSSLTSFHTWVGTYFNITDHNGGWHTDGAWTLTTAGQAKFPDMPSSYTFGNNSATYHMMSFLATTNTVLYGQNAETNFVGAVRSYANGGTFNYLSLDIGHQSYVTTGDINNFVVPWLRNSLSVIPEPSTYALFGTGLAVLGLRAWRRRR
jgi:hypothetical protein